MHSFSLFLHCHLPEVGISGLWFSAKVESKQSIKVSVITERKGQNVWEVSALIFHFSHSVSYFLFFFLFCISHLSKDFLILHTETLINLFITTNLSQYYQVER